MQGGCRVLVSELHNQRQHPGKPERKAVCMKYAGRIFCAFLILFLLSEISYSVSVQLIQDQKNRDRTETEADIWAVWQPEMPDAQPMRLKGSAVLVWRLEGSTDGGQAAAPFSEKQVRQLLFLKPQEYAGMDEAAFSGLLETRPIPRELVEAGYTRLSLESFSGWRAVIRVSKTPDGQPRFLYWCHLEQNQIRVYTADRQALVLEQPVGRPYFSTEILRSLEQGRYLESYADVAALLRPAQAENPKKSGCIRTGGRYSL